MTEPAPDPDLGRTQRLEAVRKGMAENRDMGLFGEIVLVIDAIAELRKVDQQIVDGIRHLAEQARDALADLRQDATDEFVRQRAATTALRTEAIETISTLRSDVTLALTNQGQALAALRTDATTAIASARSDASAGLTQLSGTVTALAGTVNTQGTQTTQAITADRGRLTALEAAVAAPTTGLQAKLAKIEARLTAAGIA